MEYLDFIQAWIGIFFSGITTQRIGQMLSLGVITSIGVAMYKIHTNKSNTLNLDDLFVDRSSGKINGSKVRMNLAFFVTSWVMIYSALNGTMTEWLFAGYLAAWVADRKFSRDSTPTPTEETK